MKKWVRKYIIHVGDFSKTYKYEVVNFFWSPFKFGAHAIAHFTSQKTAIDYDMSFERGIQMKEQLIYTLEKLFIENIKITKLLAS